MVSFAWLVKVCFSNIPGPSWVQGLRDVHSRGTEEVGCGGQGGEWPRENILGVLVCISGLILRG